MTPIRPKTKTRAVWGGLARLAAEQQEVSKTLTGGFKVVAKGIDLGLGELDVLFKCNIGFARSRIKKAPASGFKQLVDFDASLSFFGHVPIWYLPIRQIGAKPYLLLI